uniref:(northern house mosquito) hypothetical protein n=1 Tax=Culex pipiens TaxID=7175 RepID=A0A8D8BP58_CULPI
MHVFLNRLQLEMFFDLDRNSTQIMKTGQICPENGLIFTFLYTEKLYGTDLNTLFEVPIFMNACSRFWELFFLHVENPDYVQIIFVGWEAGLTLLNLHALACEMTARLSRIIRLLWVVKKG